MNAHKVTYVETWVQPRFHARCTCGWDAHMNTSTNIHKRGRAHKRWAASKGEA